MRFEALNLRVKHSLYYGIQQKAIQQNVLFYGFIPNSDFQTPLFYGITQNTIANCELNFNTDMVIDYWLSILKYIHITHISKSSLKLKVNYCYFIYYITYFYQFWGKYEV